MCSARLVLLALVCACSREAPAPAPPAPKPASEAPAPAPPPPASPEPKPYAGPGDQRGYCTDVRLSKDELCSCLSLMMGEAGCSVQPAGQGFGILERNGDLMVVHERDGGMLLVGFLYSIGIDSF